MSTNYLLDTSVLVLLLKQDASILHRLIGAVGSKFYVSTIALGEFYYGAEHSVNIAKSLAEVDELGRSTTILIAESDTAGRYGHMKHIQRAKGLMLPDNDLWIAATALQYGLTLAARDQHFTWIAELSLEQW